MRPQSTHSLSTEGAAGVGVAPGSASRPSAPYAAWTRALRAESHVGISPPWRCADGSAPYNCRRTDASHRDLDAGSQRMRCYPCWVSATCGTRSHDAPKTLTKSGILCDGSQNLPRSTLPMRSVSRLDELL